MFLDASSSELSLTLVDLLRERTAAAHPDRPFVEVLGERCESYAEIQAAAVRVAGVMGSPPASRWW